MISLILLISSISKLYNFKSNCFTLIILLLGIIASFTGMFLYKYLSKRYINNIYLKYKSSLKFKNKNSSNTSINSSSYNSSTSNSNENISIQQNNETQSKDLSINENLNDQNNNNNSLNNDDDHSSEITNSSQTNSYDNDLPLPKKLKNKIHIFNSIDDIRMFIIIL